MRRTRSTLSCKNAPTLVGSRYLFPYFTAACAKRIINEWARTRETSLRRVFVSAPSGAL